MESTLSVQKEITLLVTILGQTSKQTESTFKPQIELLFSLLLDSMTPDSWNHPKIQPVLMRLLILLDQKAFKLQADQFPSYQSDLLRVIRQFSNQSSLLAGFGKQLNMFFTKKKFSKFPNAVGLLSNESKFVPIFQKAILAELEKDIQGLPKDSKVLFPGAFRFLTTDFIRSKAIPSLAKSLRKSVKNLAKIRNWLSKLGDLPADSDWLVVAQFLLVLESNLCDALNKEEALQRQVFALSQALLGRLSAHAHADDKLQSAVVKFLTNMTSKLKSKRDDALMVEFAETLVCVSGKHSAKAVKLVFDGFRIALANTKGEHEATRIKSLFIRIRNLDNLGEVLTNLGQKMKEKKDVVLASPVIGVVLGNLNLAKMALKRERKKYIIKYNGKRFDCASLGEFAEYVSEQVNLVISTVGQSSLKTIKSTPDTMSPNLTNCLGLLHNSYLALLSSMRVSALSADRLGQLASVKSKNEVLESFFEWKQRVLDAPELKSKILQVLFKTNSILFRKSLVSSLSSQDCFVVLKLLKLLGEDLAIHAQKKKLWTSMSLLVFELMDSVLASSSRTKAFARGKSKSLMRSLDQHGQWRVLLAVAEIMDNGCLFGDFLLNRFTSELLLNGMFLHLAGGRFSLETHQKVNRLFAFFKSEQIDIFEISRAPQHVPADPFSLKFKLVLLLSVHDFDNNPSQGFTGWERIVNPVDRPDEAGLDLLANNWSRLRRTSAFAGSVQFGDLKTLLGDDSDQIEDFCERIMSDKGLFSRNFTVRLFSQRLLAILTLSEAKFIFCRVNWLVHPKNLQKLTRMNKIIRHIEMQDLELNREELGQPQWFAEHLSFLLGPFQASSKWTDQLRGFGYNEAEDVCSGLGRRGFPGTEEFCEERTGLFELCSELSQIPDNEDEQMAELELNSRKDAIVAKFQFYMENLSGCLGEMLSACAGLSKEEEAHVAQNSIVILDSVQANIDLSGCYMSQSLKSLFLNTYFLASRQNHVNELIEFFYHIKTGRDDSIFIRQLEKMCESLTDRPELYSRHLFDMFFAILDFLVREKLSAKSKKNVLTIVVGFLERFAELESTIFSFLVHQINSFYFDFAFDKIDELLRKALEAKGTSSCCLIVRSGACGA